MADCKGLSGTRDRKTFPSWVNVKRSHSRDWKTFPNREM
jgi:hypothetical protein